MNNQLHRSPSQFPVEAVQNGFLRLLPRIQLYAELQFRHLAAGYAKDEAIAETIALTWKWYARLVRQGKHPECYPSALVTYAAKAFRSGRRVCGQESAKDLLSPRAQRRHDFEVGSLPSYSSLNGNVWDEALHDNQQTPVPDQVAFRCDFPRWRRARSQREQSIIDQLMAGERTMKVADRFGLTPGRISQMRRELHDDWRRFTGESDEEQEQLVGA